MKSASPPPESPDLAPELSRFLHLQRQEIQRLSQIAGEAMRAEVERALVQGMAAVFRALADELPHLLDKTHPLPLEEPPPPPAPAGVTTLDLDETAEMPVAVAPPPPLDSAEQSRAAQAHLERAMHHHRAGEAGPAVTHYTEALRLDSKLPLAFLYRGLAHARNGETAAAVADADEALRLNPRLGEAYYLRAAAYTRQGLKDRAVADLTELLRLDPQHALAYNARGLARSNAGDYDQAVADFNRALRLKPTFLGARYNRAVAYRLRGNHAVAVAEFTKVLQRLPDSARAYLQRALAHLAAEKYDEAIADFDKALERDPQNVEARDRRAEAVQARQRKHAPPPAPSGEPVDAADPTLLSLSCPACGAAARVSWNRLDRLFKCRQCSRVFHIDAGGSLTEAAPSAKPRRRRLRQWMIAAAAALLLLGGAGALWYARVHQGTGLPELPHDLKGRGETWARAWVGNDRLTLRRLTATTQDRQLHPWLEKHPAPRWKDGVASPHGPRDLTIEVREVPGKPHESVLVIQIKGERLQAPAEIPLNWMQQGDDWYFAPGPPR